MMHPTLAARTIGVIGSGTHEYDEIARPLGELLAGFGVNLLTGGGSGVMLAVSRAYLRRPRQSGICIGVLPCMSEAQRAVPRTGYPNPFVELAIHTHLPHSGAMGIHDLSRNHINVLTSDAIVALPGEHGTASEVALAIRYGKPVAALSPDLQLVAHFPESVLRLRALDAVEQFLLAWSSRDSTSRRNASSPAQASARKAVRSLSPRARAA
jgi:uncharacterized protein (TIGR00725 family)